MAALLAFLVQTLLARQMSAADYGRFSAGLSLVTIMAPMACFGIGSFWLRVFGQEGWGAYRWIRNSLVYVLFSALFVMIALAAWAHWGPHDARTEMVILALSVFVLSQILMELVGVVFQLEENYNYFSFWQFSPHLARLSLLVIFLFFPLFDAYLLSALTAYFMVSVVVVLVGIAILNARLSGNLQLKGHGPSPESSSITERAGLGDVVRSSLPFGIAGFFYLVYVQMNTVLVKYWGNDEQAAYYNVAFLVITAFLLLPNMAFEKVLIPKMHRWYYQDRPMLHSVLKKSALLFAALGFVSVAVIWFAADFIAAFFFHESPEKLAETLQIVKWTIPLRSLSLCFGSVLFIGGHINLRLKLLSAVILVNVGFCYVLIPQIGASGAALSMILADACMCLLFFGAMLRALKTREGKL